MLTATGFGGLLSGSFPKIVCWTGLALGLALLTPAGIVAFMLSPIWIIAVSVLMYRRQVPTSGASAGDLQTSKAS